MVGTHSAHHVHHHLAGGENPATTKRTPSLADSGNRSADRAGDGLGEQSELALVEFSRCRHDCRCHLRGGKRNDWRWTYECVDTE